MRDLFKRFASVKRALISDIHGNLEALEAVLADIRTQDISEIYCLGDVIGYGPNPRECIDLVMKHCQICILGNHDQGALFDPEGFNSVAERAIFWTRDQLERSEGDPAANALRWDYLGELPRTVREGELLFVHGSPRRPLSEYVFPEDVYNPKKMESIFSYIQRICFQGHTHVPGVFTERPKFDSPEEANYEFRLADEKAMVNVGSVGQPRDGDPRSCYVVLEKEGGDDPPAGQEAAAESGPRQVFTPPIKLTYRRVEYSLDETVRKIYDTPELDNSLGDRLRDGH